MVSSLVAVGCISIHAMISRDQERAFARRAIKPSDIYKWPGLSFDGAGSLETGHVFIGAPRPGTPPLKWSHVVLGRSSKARSCTCLAISADGELLAASFESNATLVWRRSDGLLVQLLQGKGSEDWIQSIAFSPSGRTLVSGSSDSTAVVWDVGSGRSLARLKGHGDVVLTVAYSPDDTHIATGSFDHSVRIWDASSGVCLHSLDLANAVLKVIFSPDGSRLAVQLGSNGAICDVRTGTSVAILQHEIGKDMRLSWSHQSDRILTATNDGTAKIWNADTGEELFQLNEHADAIYSVAFSPDDTEVATASKDHTVVTCDSRTGQRHRSYQMSSGVWAVAYSPKGDYITMGDDRGYVRVCDAKSGVFLAEFGGHAARISDVQFLPNGNDLVSRSLNDGTVRLWSIRDALRIRLVS